MTATAYAYSVDHPRRLVTVRVSGAVHGTQVAATYAAIYRDPACGPSFDIFWDTSRVTELILESDDLPSFVRLSQEFSTPASSGRDIILVARVLDQAIADMYAVMMRTERRAVHVCPSMDEVHQILAATDR
jgi:hypothetical protein